MTIRSKYPGTCPEAFWSDDCLYGDATVMVRRGKIDTPMSSYDPAQATLRNFMGDDEWSVGEQQPEQDDEERTCQWWRPVYSGVEQVGELQKEYGGSLVYIVTNRETV